ncbi:hypothetical protein [Clostridium perfringens]|uniref:Uncharacterized protein n=2 Tax=Clostridium perfringens TaxID=1502 RepID=A0AAP6WQS6_CLOPF|nr:hypothetical protein [Clostridium perfringens]EDT23618.1 hypothetical protein AC1_0048 [Clostridium perfringens B str. ATCC 3626]MCX0366278.1 hypothetical protein [Clostridium perfringens]NGU31426.1 hypothetical protein [Clostridium perfringens]WEV05459.1 hypothetical protein PL322_00220 [Clostridium perfringens B]
MSYTLEDKALQLLKENGLSENLINQVDLTRDLTVERSIQEIVNRNKTNEFVNVIKENQVKR